MKKIITLFQSFFTLMLLLSLTKHISAQTYVNIPASFNSESGCPGDWMPDCNNSGLTYNNGNGLWEGTFNIPAGNWEYKVAIDHSWNENYGTNGIQNGPNISLNLPVAKAVTFTYNPITHFVTDSYNNNPTTVTIVGSFQSGTGCGGDWDPTCTYTDLVYDGASGEWYNAFYLPAGNYEFKVVIGHSWNENYGQGGVPGGANYNLSLANYSRVSFRYNPSTHIVTATIVNNAVVLAGSFQNEAGCPADWSPDCYNTSMYYNITSNLWTKELVLPAGSFEFKAAIDYSWNENYGTGGVLNGTNYILNLANTSKINFTYNPVTHIVSYIVSSFTVVIPGSFQSELGCVQDQVPVGGDWEPACDFTRLTYDADQHYFVGTWMVGAGHWEYKVAINNSWGENYGLYGVRGGDNIPLDLKYPCKITFKYDPVSHYVYLDYVTSYVCVTKFYDANVNGYQDYNEPPMAGVSFTLVGKDVPAQTLITGADGTVCFSGLPANEYYGIKETKPAGYIASTADSQSVYVNYPTVAYFGNVCLGAGGARGIGYWTSKNGETVLNQSGQLENILMNLRYFGLRNADGSDFDPYTYTQLKTWMLDANAKNMMNMLSAQLAAMYMNMQLGYVDMYNSYIYTPGCGFWGNNNFMNVYTLVWYTNYLLWNNTTVTGKNPDRAYIDCLKNGFDNANKNLSFVQPGPCSNTISSTNTKRPSMNLSLANTDGEPKVWPNPTNSYFTLQPSMLSGNDRVQIRVMDINGKQVYVANGVAAANYKFGEQFKAGLYLIEITQGSKRTTIKVVKQ